MTTTQLSSHNFGVVAHRFRLKGGLAFGAVLVVALLAFEIFNYSTTEFALIDLLGDLGIASFRWATILAIALCGIDTAGIARLFSSGNKPEQHSGVWYLFAAWLLAATMNAIFTWWGVSVAMMDHTSSGNSMVVGDTFLYIVPVSVAIMVWLIRVLIIGTFSVMGKRFFTQEEVLQRGSQVKTLARRSDRLANTIRAGSLESQPRPSGSLSYQPNPKSRSQSEISSTRPEPTYHPASVSARGSRSTISKVNRS
jgi:hypothetical protein